MGQEHSVEPVEVSPEQLSRELALKFAAKCYTQLELYCFKEVFRTLADTESGLKYWTEATLCRFLGLPDVLGAGPVINQMATYLGAFPFPSQAPCILTIEALLKIVTLMTRRYAKVLKRGDADRMRLFYSSLAVFDRRASDVHHEVQAAEGCTPAKAGTEEAGTGGDGFEVDKPANDDIDGEDYDDDELTMAALDALDAVQAIGLGDKPNRLKSIIPTDNFLRLTQLLLLIAPLDSQENLAKYSAELSEEDVKRLRDVASNIVGAFGVIEHQTGITFHAFKAVVPNALPYIFDGLSPLFEHFLFEKEFDLSKRKRSSSFPASPASPSTEDAGAGYSKPLARLVPEGGEIMNPMILRQISCFIPPSSLFTHLNFLYSCSLHGFSMGSFEKRAFNWHAPTLLLVSGTLLPDEPSVPGERSFAESLPPKRFPNGNMGRRKNNRVTYGAYIPVPWKQTHREPFGNSSTMLFQLSPIHDVFRASSVSKDYITCIMPGPGALYPGINFGSSMPAKGTSQHVPLGAVSLYLADSLEYAVFTHTSGGGGSFYSSNSPARTHPPRAHQRAGSMSATSTAAKRRSTMTGLAETKPGDWQDRFEIDSLEVWGLGGEKEAERQRKHVEWEEREARRRRESIVGDIETEREILRMAGLIGHGESGGSMG